MATFASFTLGPFYRLVYGRPVEDQLPFPPTIDGDEPPLSQACRGLLIVADGVGGFRLCSTTLRYLVAADHLPYAFHTVPWGHGLGRWYADLTDMANQRRHALDVAATVRRFREKLPDAPVFLVGKSGGTAIIVGALEQLADAPVERAILLAPALSAGYDLTRALAGVRRDITVFWSPYDWFFLGLGTRLFGTVDGRREPGAGRVGFRIDPAHPADPERERRYARLNQVRWRPGMAASGHLGGHLGPDSPIFLRKYIMPLLRGTSVTQVLNPEPASSRPGA